MNRILGIDLAAQAGSTGVVMLSRRDLRWDAEEPSGAATDDRLVGAWNILVKGYKGATAERAGTAPSARAEIIDRIGEACPWLELDHVRARCVASDHVLDALLCCLVAMAASVGCTATATDADAARAEGWIHVPTASLASLRPPET